MWMGCVFLLVVFAVSFLLEHGLVTGLGLPAPWLAAGGLGFGVMLLAGSLHGLYDAFRKQLRPETDPATWQDGQLVRVGGMIRAAGQNLRAPFSGQEVVLFDYKFRQSISPGSEVSKAKRVASFSAVEMAPATLLTAQGSIGLRGFPNVQHLPAEVRQDEECYPQAAREIVRNHWKVADAREALNVLGAGLSGDTFHPPMYWVSRAAVERLIAPQGAPCAASYEGGPPAQLTGQEAEAEIVRRMCTRGWTAEERCIPNGAEVTVEGTYDASSRSIDMAHSITKPQHTIRLGLAAQTASRELSQAIWFIVIFAAILAGLHYVVYADGGALYRRLIEQFG